MIIKPLIILLAASCEASPTTTAKIPPLAIRALIIDCIDVISLMIVAKTIVTKITFFTRIGKTNFNGSVIFFFIILLIILFTITATTINTKILIALLINPFTNKLSICS